MPDSCCAVDCANRRAGKNKNLPFYRIPSARTAIGKRQRQEWIRALRRDDWKKWTEHQMSKQKVCGEHFISGKKSDDAENIDWVPSKFKFNEETALKVAAAKQERNKRHKHISAKRQKMDKPETDKSTECEPNSSQDPTENLQYTQSPATEQDCPPFGKSSQFLGEADLLKKVRSLEAELLARNTEIHGLRTENCELREKVKKFGFNSIKNDDDLVKFFTGLPTAKVFIWVSELVMGEAALCHSSLTSFDHVLLVFMRLRLGLLNKDLAYRFEVPHSTVSKAYRTWLPVLSVYLRQLIIWPDKVTLRCNLPQSFGRKFRDCVCIIDCSEIFIERPSNLTARAQTWSNYKHHNTCKYLIGISPAGAVTFLSEGWGGRVSDKQITTQSGFLDKMSNGDCILADRGFLIQEELSERGAVLMIPKFTRGKNQLSGKDVDESRQLAHVRIHVERVIGRLKDFRILQTVIPISQVDLIDEMMVVICGAINLNRSVVGKN